VKKVLLDTNIVLDAIAAREPFLENAEAIFRLIKNKQIAPFITSNSVTDIYYIARKNRSEAETRNALRILLGTFSVVDVRGQECREALDSPVDDYEDALLCVCGLRAGVDCVVTRDAALLSTTNSSLEIYSPDAFLKNVSPASRRMKRG
jgi:predicted nucleic acid-binding protein